MTREFKFKFDWLLWFLILLPTFYVVNKDIRDVQQYFFQISIIFMVAVLHVNKWLGAFLAFSAFQLVFFPEMPQRSLAVQNICFAFILYHFIVQYVGSFKKYFWALFGLLALNTGWAYLQMFQLDFIFGQANPQNQNYFSEYSGFFSVPAFFGNFAAVISPLLSCLNPFLALFVIPALIFSKSSFSILAAIVGILFFFWFKKRIVFWALLVIFLVTGGFYITKYDAPTGQFSRRLKVWNLILKEGFKKQFFGHGIGSFNEKYTFVETTPNHRLGLVRNNNEMALFIVNSAIEMNRKEVVDYMLGKNPNDVDYTLFEKDFARFRMGIEIWNPAHNEFLEVFFEMGLLGLFLVFGYIVNLMRRFFVVFKKTNSAELLALASSFLAILIVSFAHFPFQVARLAGPFIVIVALFEAKLLRDEE